MTIKIKLGELVGAEPVLSELVKEKLPFKTSYHIARLLKKANDDLKLFGERRNELVQKYGLVDVANGGFSIKPGSPNWAAFEEAINEVVAVEITIDADTLPIEAMGDLPWPVEKLFAIMWLFAEPVVA